jgi:hypothetical protein
VLAGKKQLIKSENRVPPIAAAIPRCSIGLFFTYSL